MLGIEQIWSKCLNTWSRLAIQCAYGDKIINALLLRPPVKRSTTQWLLLPKSSYGLSVLYVMLNGKLTTRFRSALKMRPRLDGPHLRSVPPQLLEKNTLMCPYISFVSLCGRQLLRLHMCHRKKMMRIFHKATGFHYLWSNLRTNWFWKSFRGGVLETIVNFTVTNSF